MISKRPTGDPKAVQGSGQCLGETDEGRSLQPNMPVAPPQSVALEVYRALMAARSFVAAAELLDRTANPYTASQSSASRTLERVDGALADFADHYPI